MLSNRSARRFAFGVAAASILLLAGTAWRSSRLEWLDPYLLDGLGLSAEPEHFRLSSTKSKETSRWTTITSLSLDRTVWTSPEPAVILPGEQQLTVIAAVVTDQRSTWQEGSRPPFYIRVLLYTEPLDQARAESLSSWYQRVNVTWPDYPSIESSRCRPFAYQSNWPPLRDILAPELIIQIECDIPAGVADEQTGPPERLSAHLSYQTIKYNETVETELLKVQESQGRFFDYPQRFLSTPEAAQMNLVLHRKDMRYTKYTFCAAPFRDYDKMIGDLMPLRYIEYRLYWQALGVTRFVWYAYRTEPRWITFLRAFLSTFDNEDEILIVDNLVGPAGYHDQNLWLGHCGHNYRTATDYLLILDLDETIALNPAHYDDPARHFDEWIDSWKPDVGAYSMLRVDLAMSRQTFEEVVAIGSPTVEMLAQDVWTARCTDPWLVSRYLRKTIHRALAPMQIWIHHATWMYPMPAQEPELPLLSRQDDDWPKPFVWQRKEWPHEQWHQNISGVVDYVDLWPRCYHFRWWGGQAKYEIGDEPLPSHPHQVAFQNALREQVLRTGRLIQPGLVVQAAL